LEYLTLSDIYLFSSKIKPGCKGTAYAMSCGCTVISTPIPHAVEMLSDSTGILLTKLMTLTKRSNTMAIENKEQRVTMGKNAFRSHRVLPGKMCNSILNCYSIN
jgi:hypothetical protein